MSKKNDYIFNVKQSNNMEQLKASDLVDFLQPMCELSDGLFEALGDFCALGYKLIACSDLSFQEKRSLLFALYSFRLRFDDKDFSSPPKELIDYGCCFVFEEEAGRFLPESDNILQAEQHALPVVLSSQAAMILFSGEKKIKLDVGSFAFDCFVKEGVITGIFAEHPSKLSLSNLVDSLVVLCGFDEKGNFDKKVKLDEKGNFDEKVKLDEKGNSACVCGSSERDRSAPIENLAASNFDFNNHFDSTHKTDGDADCLNFISLLFIFMPYFFAAEEFSSEQTQRLRDQLFCDSTFFAVLESKHEELIPSCTEDLSSELTRYWFSDYIQWKTTPTGSGKSRIISKYYALLSGGSIAEALKGAETLFALYPTDEQALLLLLAARTANISGDSDSSMFSENIELILEALPLSKSPAELTYYLGLGFLGLKAIDKAVAVFKICKSMKPDFQPALDMLKKLGADA